MLGGLISGILKGAFSIGASKKKEVDTRTVASQEQTIKSVDDAVEVGRKNRKEHKQIEKEEINLRDKDGGLDFDDTDLG
jgi:hypothetical protein